MDETRRRLLYDFMLQTLIDTSLPHGSTATKIAKKAPWAAVLVRGTAAGVAREPTGPRFRRLGVWKCVRHLGTLGGVYRTLFLLRAQHKQLDFGTL